MKHHDVADDAAARPPGPEAIIQLENRYGRQPEHGQVGGAHGALNTLARTLKELR